MTPSQSNDLMGLPAAPLAMPVQVLEQPVLPRLFHLFGLRPVQARKAGH